MVLERPFGLKEPFKPMSACLVSLIFEKRIFAKKTTTAENASFLPIFSHFKKKFRIFSESTQISRLKVSASNLMKVQNNWKLAANVNSIAICMT